MTAPVWRPLTSAERKRDSRERRGLRTLELPPEAFEAIEALRQDDDAGLGATVTRLVVMLANSPAVSKNDLLSGEAIEAYRLADYRLRHNARYHNWPEDRKVGYKLAAAFDAALANVRRKQ